jgi:hypothetical protein
MQLAQQRRQQYSMWWLTDTVAVDPSNAVVPASDQQQLLQLPSVCLHCKQQ